MTSGRWDGRYERYEKGTTFELDLEGISKQAKVGLIKWNMKDDQGIMLNACTIVLN